MTRGCAQASQPGRMPDKRAAEGNPTGPTIPPTMTNALGDDAACHGHPFTVSLPEDVISRTVHWPDPGTLLGSGSFTLEAAAIVALSRTTETGLLAAGAGYWSSGSIRRLPAMKRQPRVRFSPAEARSKADQCDLNLRSPRPECDPLLPAPP